MTKELQLLFVYNADSSLAAKLKDYVHKSVSPSTYACSLCQITYGGLGMKTEWKDFLETLPQEVVFLHRDELHKEYPKLKGITFPLVLKKEADQLTEFISAKEINQQKTVPDLKALVTLKLKTYESGR